MKTRMIKNLFSTVIGLICLMTLELHAAKYIVTNTNDSGPGSLREALSQCMVDGPDTVLFNIPTSDPHYNSTTGVWTIYASSYFYVPEYTLLDGAILGAPLGKKLLPRPGIEIDGTTLVNSGVNGVSMGKRVTVRGLIVNHFDRGFYIPSDSVTIQWCYVGTDPTGLTEKSVGSDGILIINAAYVVIQESLISGSYFNGIRLTGSECIGNTIRNNRVGTDILGMNAIPNDQYGIVLYNGARKNVIENNLVSGNHYQGIELEDTGTDSNSVRFNRVGTTEDGLTALPNEGCGIGLFNGPCDNTIGPGNRVAYNSASGIVVDGANSYTSTVRNKITQNNIAYNGTVGINNFRGGNTESTPPTISSVTTTQVTGTAGANQTVEIFFDAEDEGSFYLGTAIADASGNFTYAVSVPLPPLPHATATATDADGNTSEFSDDFTPTGVEEESENSISPELRLNQNRPNPFNGSTDISYSIPRSGHVRLAVYDMLGREVLTLVKEIQIAGVHTVRFDASGLSSGIYVYRIRTGGEVMSRKLLLMR